MILEIFKMWNLIKSGRLSHVSSQLVMIPSSRSLFSRDKRVPESIWITGKRFGESIFYVWFTQRSSWKNPIWWRAKKPWSSPWSRKDEDQSHKWRQTKSRHNSNADICNKTVDYEFYNGRGITAEQHGRTAKTANIGTAIRQIPQSTIIVGEESTIQNSSDYLFWFFHRMLCCGSKKWRSRIPNSRRRSASRSRKPKKSIGFYEEDSSPSWSTTIFERLALMLQYETLLIYSLLLIMMTTFRNSIQDGTKLYCQC